MSWPGTLPCPARGASRGWHLAALWLCCAVLPAQAAPVDLSALAREFFPETDQIGPLAGNPPAHAVAAAGRLLGFVFRTDDIAPIPAYSGQPVAVAVGLAADGRIRDLRIVEHQEPILVVGVDDQRLAEYVHQYRGLAVRDRIKVGGSAGPGEVTVDAISGATITVMVINASVTRAARRVADSRGLPIDEASLAAALARLENTPADTSTGTNEPAAASDGSTPRDGSPAGNASPRPMTTTPEADDEPPLWAQIWAMRELRLSVLGAGLLVLTTILVLQDWLTRYPVLVRRLRTGFLVWTLLFIGWFSLAQLSVVNVFTFVHAVMRGFSWDTFLIEPLIFVLWAYVAVTLLLWGRGVYCGWLCPFGALQELTGKLARLCRVPQYNVPALIHERLLAIKYVALLGLFGLSLQSMPEAVRWSELEPFKTAITLRFDRAWPYVAYALALIALSAVNGKFFCKYLCPLGAALAIASHFRIFDWLRRRRECGRPCQTCYVECPSQAIRPTGEINANECHHCLDCQVTYWNAHKCPPLVELRKRAERRGTKLRLRP